VPVSAKMRLGVNDTSRALDCALAITEAGADELVVHGRTKLDGYRPPAYWEHIHEIQRSVAIPVVANGEIWSVADARRCRELSGCDALMLGRGIVRDPGLALAIVADQNRFGAPHDGPGVPWQQLLPLIREFWFLIEAHIEPKARAGRLKQWLNFLRRRHPQAEAAYAAVRTINDPALVALHLNLSCRANEPCAAAHVEARDELLETLT
jgi:tRNA-dihydrouridine synthase C